MWRKGNPHALLVGMSVGTITMDNSIEVPQKLKIKLQYNPAISLLGFSQRIQKHYFETILHLDVHCSTIYKSQDMETT